MFKRVNDTVIRDDATPCFEIRFNLKGIMMEQITQALLEWYDVNGRVLPWRGIRDPYRTWISEIMLQQTRVDTVIPYYQRFILSFPTVNDLASASLDDVLKQWEGLGYYSRANNLWNGARQIVEEFSGNIPEDPCILMKIKGIGPYTAHAIASIGYNQAYLAVDGNITRVMSRVFGIRDELSTTSAKTIIENAAASVIPEERPGDFNQACMDLASSICLPRSPDCGNCPVSSFCDANKTGDAASLPRLKAAIPPKDVHYILPVVFSGNKVLLRKRKEKLLQGLWCFPLLENDNNKAPSACLYAFLNADIESLNTAGHTKHIFSHIVWHMDLYTITLRDNAEAPGEYRWIETTGLDDLAFPAAMRSALDLVKKKMNAPVF